MERNEKVHKRKQTWKIVNTLWKTVLPILYIVLSLLFNKLNVNFAAHSLYFCLAPDFQSPILSCLLDFKRWATKNTNISA